MGHSCGDLTVNTLARLQNVHLFSLLSPRCCFRSVKLLSSMTDVRVIILVYTRACLSIDLSQVTPFLFVWSIEFLEYWMALKSRVTAQTYSGLSKIALKSWASDRNRFEIARVRPRGILSMSSARSVQNRGMARNEPNAILLFKPASALCTSVFSGLPRIKRAQ